MRREEEREEVGVMATDLTAKVAGIAVIHLIYFTNAPRDFAPRVGNRDTMSWTRDVQNPAD